jgi:hypothetical protein
MGSSSAICPAIEITLHLHRISVVPDAESGIQTPTFLAMLAHTFLTVIAARQTPSPRSESPSSPTPAPGLILLTRNEVRHLFVQLSQRIHASVGFILHWSIWRRHHQAVARASHYHRQPRFEGTPKVCHHRATSRWLQQITAGGPGRRVPNRLGGRPTGGSTRLRPPWVSRRRRAWMTGLAQSYTVFLTTPNRGLTHARSRNLGTRRQDTSLRSDGSGDNAATRRGPGHHP